jgi:hypothetical protein
MAGLKFVKFFKRPCNYCGKIYQRTGKYQKICDECYDKVSGISKNKLKHKKNEQKKR